MGRLLEQDLHWEHELPLVEAQVKKRNTAEEGTKEKEPFWEFEQKCVRESERDGHREKEEGKIVIIFERK